MDDAKKGRRMERYTRVVQAGPGKRGVKLEEERMKRESEHAAREREREGEDTGKNRGGKA